jgi:hypothetical protein
MRNLLERLKPEHKMNLEICLKDYPLSLKSIFNELENNFFIVDLRLETVFNINVNLFMSTLIDFNKIFDLFND